MFTEDNTLNLDSTEGDTTLTDDELMNITSGDGIQIEETAAEENNDLDDISFDSLEENSVNDADLSGFDDVSIEEPSESTDEDVSLDDFTFDETETAAPSDEGEAVTEETVPEEVPVENDSAEEMNIEGRGVFDSKRIKSVSVVIFSGIRFRITMRNGRMS